MVNANKRKGDNFNRDVIKYLQAEGITGAHRYQDGFHLDRGDVAGIPGLVIQCKNWKTPRWTDWFDDVDDQVEASGGRFGIVALKRRGNSDAGSSLIAFSPSHWDFYDPFGTIDTCPLGASWSLNKVFRTLDSGPLYTNAVRTLKTLSMQEPIYFSLLRTVVPFIQRLAKEGR